MEQAKKKWWGAKYLNPQDKERDIKLIVFVASTGCAAWWLTKEQGRGAITEQWVEAFKYFLMSSTLGGAAWYAVDKWRGGKVSAVTDTPDIPTAPKDGGTP
jgi:hypothetical protein